MYRGHIGWTSSKLSTRIISLGSWLLGSTTLAIWSKRNTLKFGWNRAGFAVLRKPAISLKRGKIGPRLLLMTNRKSHTRFRLVRKSSTLDDIEGVSKHVRLSVNYVSLFHNICHQHSWILCAVGLALHGVRRCSASVGHWNDKFHTDSCTTID